MKARIRAINGLTHDLNLGSIKTPSLYLQALHDRVVPESSYLSIKRSIPNLTLEKINGPHCLLQVNPSGSARAVEHFLNSVT
jgi:pimeloyl-[acyl-carrier protein] methyl ester esterase